MSTTQQSTTTTTATTTTTQQFVKQNMLHFLGDFASSCLGIMLSMFVSHPIDTLRVRRQTHLLSPLESVRRHGLLSVYHGLATPLLTTGPVVASSMALNDAFKRAFLFYGSGGECHLSHNRDHESDTSASGSNGAGAEQRERTLSFLELAVAGGCAGVASAVLQCPIAVIRIQQQVRAEVRAKAIRANLPPAPTAGTHNHSIHSGVATATRQAHHPTAHKQTAGPTASAHRPSPPRAHFPRLGFIPTALDVFRHQGGWRSFYRGLPLEATQAGIGRLVYFTVYQRSKEFLAEAFRVSPSTDNNTNNIISRRKNTGKSSTSSSPDESSSYAVPLLAQWFMAGVSASWCGWIIIYPCDVIKSRLQGDYFFRGDETARMRPRRFNGVVHCARMTVKELGIRGLWLGLPLTLCRSIASSGVCLPAYEVIRPHMRRALDVDQKH